MMRGVLVDVHGKILKVHIGIDGDTMERTFEQRSRSFLLFVDSLTIRIKKVGKVTMGWFNGFINPVGVRNHRVW